MHFFKQTIVLLITSMVLTACASVQGGIAVHPTGTDRPEVQGMDNPIGVIRLESNKYKRLSVVFQHNSSIPVWERGTGFNTLGVYYEFKK